jgi:hypothetical protein
MFFGVVSTWDMTLITQDRCQDICGESTFFAVYGNSCICGDGLSALTRFQDRTSCVSPCEGNSNQKCGGLQNSVANAFVNIAACGTLDTRLRVRNPGFENGAISWTPTRTGTGTINWSVRTDAGIANTGSRYARFDLFAGAVGDLALTQNIAICPGTAYILTVYAKKSNVAAACSIQAYLNNQQVIADVVGTVWAPSSAFVKPSTDPAKLDLRIGCDVNTNGYLRQVFVDSVELRPATADEVATFSP